MTPTVTTTPEPQCLPLGTVTPFGTLAERTLTGFFTSERTFVPFAKLRTPTRHEPLVRLG